VRELSRRRAAALSVLTGIRALLRPTAYVDAFVEGVSLLGRHRKLMIVMVRRELALRHVNQMMGSFWIIGHPLFLMALFVFLFGVVFNPKVGDTYELPRDYTVYILSGLVPWLALIPALTASCSSVVGNAALVKQFVFHLEILPAKDVLTASVVWVVGIAVITLYTLLEYHSLPWTYLLLPFAAMVHLLAVVGLAFLFSALTVFFRDIQDFVTVFANVGVYIVPVTYLPQWVPAMFRPVLYLNPFSYLIWMYQDVLYFGRIEHPGAWLVSTAGSVLIFAFGYRVFRRLKPMFGNAL
jgi:lipopolysaccharide transport system permease protein